MLARAPCDFPQSVSAIYAGFLAMTLYPAVAAKAQAEIDDVIGSDRLPTFEDRPHLPYVNAFIKEVIPSLFADCQFA